VRKVEVSIMAQDEDGADPLLEAIGEFRLELMHWIDRRMRCLQEQESQTEPVLGAERISPRSSPAEPPQAIPDGDARSRLDTLARHQSDRLRGGDASRAGPGRPGHPEEASKPAR
jgi:hypothetical protein